MNIKVLIATVSVFGLAAPAYAQTSAPAAGAPAEDGDIVVTANRTESLASKTAVALTAVTGAALQNAGITNPTNLAEIVPNLSIDRHNGLILNIRGVSSTDRTEKGDSSAGFLVDGIFIARPQAQETAFFDLERVEVLRGPQGTLYGRNATAGVIHLITKRPSLTDGFSGYLNASYGNYDNLQASAAVNIPLNDIAALRIAGSLDRRDGFATSLPTDPKKYGRFRDDQSIRGTLLLKPSDSIEVVLRADYTGQKGNVSIAGPFVDGNRFFAPIPAGQPTYTDRQYIGDQYSTAQLLDRGYALAQTPNTDNSIWGLSGEINWDVGPATITYLGGFRRLVRHELSTIPFSGVPYAIHFDGQSDQESHELRLATNGDGPFKGQIGAYYFNETTDQFFWYENRFPGIPVFGFDMGPVTAKSYAFFGQATYSFTPKLRFTAGLRYTKDERSRYGWIVRQQTTTFNPLTDTRQANDATIESSRITWRLGLEYDVAADTLAYATISTGYKAGGFNDGCLLGSTNRDGVVCSTANVGAQARPPEILYYQPEELTAYEIGIKARVGSIARISANAFYYDYRNLQLSTLGILGGAPVGITSNAARARVKGIELEAVITPGAGHRFSLAAAYTDSEYVDYHPLGGVAAPDYAGRPLDRTPKFTFSPGYSYTFSLKNNSSLEFDIRTKYSDSYVVSDFGNARQYRQPSATKTNAAVTYHAPNDRWSLQAFVRNIENNVSVSSTQQYGTSFWVVPSDPRTYGVRFNVNF